MMFKGDAASHHDHVPVLHWICRHDGRMCHARGEWKPDRVQFDRVQ